MSLKKISAEMHTEAKKYGRSSRTLSRGLHISLFYRSDDIVLALSRRNTLPSDLEVSICRTTFLFDQPLTNQAVKGNTVYLAIDKSSLYETEKKG